MRIVYHKKFIKNFKKRFFDNQKLKDKYRERLRLFIDNPANPILKNHALVGEKVSLRAFSISGDVRIVYLPLDSQFIFLDIGTHNQIY